MLDLLPSNLTNLALLDPPAARFFSPRLVDVATRQRATDLTHALYAFDIDAEHVAETRRGVTTLLTARGLPSGDATRLAEAWVHFGDFLLAPLSQHFDVVVGNPPYVRIEQIAPVLQAEYRRRYSTLFDRADLYVAFFERGLRLLTQHGTLCFVCADRWVLNRYGARHYASFATSIHDANPLIPTPRSSRSLPERAAHVGPQAPRLPSSAWRAPPPPPPR